MQNFSVFNLFYSKKYIITWLYKCYPSSNNNESYENNKELLNKDNIKLQPPEINIIERLEEGLLQCN